jgi:hypothetical protein
MTSGELQSITTSFTVALAPRDSTISEDFSFFSFNYAYD